MSTHHIRATREAWLDHRDKCASCFTEEPPLCELGQVLKDEWAAAITANPSCEHITGTEPNKEAT